jgi:hypothetical protein
MDCLTLGEGGNLLASCFGEASYLDWRVWLARSPVLIPALVVCALLVSHYVRRWRRVTKWRHTAHRRAEQLLRERLTPCEYKDLQRSGFLDISSRLCPQRYYRIPRHRGRVWVYEASTHDDTLLWRKTGELCLVAIEDVPDADLVLSHKWMIEGDEAGYLALANWIRIPDTGWTLYTGAPTSLRRGS